jgi:hypothetical protein
MQTRSSRKRQVTHRPDPVYPRLTPAKGIETLTRHAFNSPSLTTSRNALRCLANAMLLQANTRKFFIDLGYEAKACNKLKNDSRDDEFLVSRIIFLTTYDSNVNIEKLIDQHHLAEIICMNISRHTKQYITKQKKVKELDPMEDMALIESLKLLFNLTHFCPQRSLAFSPALPHILMILSKRAVSSTKPLEAPIGPLVNSLINLPLEQKDNVNMLFPKACPNVNSERLLDILEKSTKVYHDDELEQLVSPLLILIRKIYELAPNEVQRYIQKALLPTNEDRKQILGRGESLSARLLRLSTNINTPQVREVTSSLLFELSGKDATTFVQNVGYGFASGFLFQHKVPIPENALEAWSTRKSTSDSESSNPRASQESSTPVNPITGQTLESETVIEMPELTQEEKEREAEKLFVLFERYIKRAGSLLYLGCMTLTSAGLRLKKTGVMKVQNPVETAYQEGRFLELDDDAESE